jgi:hypothetical protein
MHKPGTDPENVQMSDILCDFCRREWTEEMALVEGHRGSVICGDCLTEAYRSLVVNTTGSSPAGYQCTMCLESRPDLGWQSPRHAEANICARCCRQSAGILVKDKETNWHKPTE